MRNKMTLTDVLEGTFHYNGIEYNYDRNSDNCTCEDYCRCSTLENTKIESIDLIAVAKVFSEVLGEDEFTEYAINRILTACKMYDSNYWDFRVCGGYYGEEVDGIYIDNTEVSKWMYKLESAKTDKEKLFIALECEYDYILDELNKCENWNIVTIKKSDIRIGQQDHYRKLDRMVVENYKNFTLPVAVCIEENGHARLIDGYHRCKAKDEESIKVIIGKL